MRNANLVLNTSLVILGGCLKSSGLLHITVHAAGDAYSCFVNFGAFYRALKSATTGVSQVCDT